MKKEIKCPECGGKPVSAIIDLYRGKKKIDSVEVSYSEYKKMKKQQEKLGITWDEYVKRFFSIYNKRLKKVI